MFKRRIYPAFALIFLASCACANAELTGAALGPADPSAQEAPAPAMPDLSPDGPGPHPPPACPAMQPHHGDHEHVSDYTCPMHPAVHSPAKGTCPQCGMKLVPSEKQTQEGRP